MRLNSYETPVTNQYKMCFFFLLVWLIFQFEMHREIPVEMSVHTAVVDLCWPYLDILSMMIVSFRAIILTLSWCSMLFCSSCATSVDLLILLCLMTMFLIKHILFQSIFRSYSLLLAHLAIGHVSFCHG